jgi:hypothetical protein
LYGSSCSYAKLSSVKCVFHIVYYIMYCIIHKLLISRTTHIAKTGL